MPVGKHPIIVNRRPVLLDLLLDLRHLLNRGDSGLRQVGAVGFTDGSKD
jgi:hypothetical protein